MQIQARRLLLQIDRNVQQLAAAIAASGNPEFFLNQHIRQLRAAVRQAQAENLRQEVLFALPQAQGGLARAA